ncbi:MAG: hypothetical protein JXR67_07695, partial [Bacteroidales bacterium]|nr:hypothetical protein [Bacteroidales bacterium]
AFSGEEIYKKVVVITVEKIFEISELDLVLTKGNRPVTSIEIKYGSDARPTRGNTEAVQTLKTYHNYIIVKDDEDYLLSGGFRICGLRIFLEKYLNSQESDNV